MDVLDSFERRLQHEIAKDTALVMTGGCDPQAYARHCARVEAFQIIIDLIQRARRSDTAEFEPKEEDFSVGR